LDLGAEAMARRPSFWRSPAGIVLGYLLALVAATAGVVSFPVSIISLGLLFVVVGVFFVVAISVIVMAYVFMLIAFYRGFASLARRLVVSDQDTGRHRRTQLSSLNIDSKQPGSYGLLWDRWIDGYR
jgi:hypothetical protein